MKDNEQKEEYKSASEFINKNPDQVKVILEQTEKELAAIQLIHAELVAAKTLQVAAERLRWVRRTKSTIARVPGYGTMRFVQGVCPPKFRERELAALMGDASEAYCQAVASGNKWGALRLRFLTPVWVFGVALKGVASALVGTFSKAVKTGSE